VKRLLLFGYFGLGNFGDDLLLWTICLRLGRLVEKGEVELTVLSRISHDKLPIPATYIPRKNHSAVLKAIKAVDIVCAPGGGLLQDTTSVPSLLYYLGIIQAATVHRKRIALIAQGIGPVTSPIGRRLLPSALSRVDYLSVRDTGSAELLASLGLKTKVQVTTDLTFALRRALMPGEIRPAVNEDPDCINVLYCPKRFGKWEEQVAQLAASTYTMRRLFSQSEVRFGFAPLHAGEDSELASAVAEKIDANYFQYDSTDPIANCTIFDWAQVVVSFRLHGCIIAAQQKTPFVAVAYDPKVAAIAERFSMPCIDPVTADHQSLAQAAHDCYHSGFGSAQKGTLEETLAVSERDIDALVSLIQS
jgi:polysaccharide pyruvyl transferase CsaB